ncbi:dihydrolipoyl dehydrogenase [Xanthomonas hortorum]|uniref:Dihydrolipoyl dehydrogenase n=1 Tax=Xanthomonas hortorum pv. hederae TaxID=453603 RepID=A0A9X3YZ06_9XANT|nr:dihydrolipoyl dehydrogenase [Xanthomonas hortorum]MCE4369647.1 dihydrolipoyl dehydrogenase [Xanthomonas hortorum pv. hederae]MDC8637145.1 dihydrolipoyl dehydrogenase [Xanthomonas hortorum pv. hederae]PPU86191.1 dihydrolipoyl dehydrogenase [Xanthomonas hortorum pv. hederae]PUF01254.1 dihydrolipoyl dehydrogenase [Xanthomonas hortorum pv. hederae]
MSTHYEVVVIGAGPGGYVAAIRAAQLGKSVAVIERQYWGGVCLNIGCIPSKSLLRNAELAHIFRHQAAQFGISGEAVFDYGAAVDRSRKVADGRAKGVHYLMRKNNITEIDGHGTFVDVHSIQVALASGESQTLTFDNAIIATGSTVRLLPDTELSENVVTYETQILARDLPGSIVIVGAGAIGVEFAYILANYGVGVTLIEFLDRPLPNEDAEISKEIVRQYKKLGVEILTSAKVESIDDYGTYVAVSYTASNGEQSTVSADKVLMSVGFAPRTGGYGLENTGVALTDGGAIAIDDAMRTSVPHLYAIGDVTAKLQLAHVAEAQAIVAAETIAGVETMPLDYRMMPRATFGQPQVASFGLTEQQALDEGFEINVAKFPFTANGKAQGQGDPSGFIKLIGDAKDGTLLGGHLVGHDVSELLPELTLAQKWGLTAAQVARNVHTHPTLGEALQEGFHGLAGHMINL